MSTEPNRAIEATLKIARAIRDADTTDFRKGVAIGMFRATTQQNMTAQGLMNGAKAAVGVINDTTGFDSIDELIAYAESKL